MELYQPSSRSPEPPLPPRLMLEFGQWLQSWADFAQQQASTWLSAAADDGPPRHWQNLVMDDAPPAHWLALLQENGMEWGGGSGAAAGQTEKAAWLLEGEPINGRFPHLWLPLFHEGIGFFFQQFGFPLGTNDAAPPSAPATPFTQPPTAVAQPQPDTAPVSLPAETFASPNPLPMIGPNDTPAGSSVPLVLPTGWLSVVEDSQPPATLASTRPRHDTEVIQRKTAVFLPIAPQPPATAPLPHTAPPTIEHQHSATEGHPAPLLPSIAPSKRYGEPPTPAPAAAAKAVVARQPISQDVAIPFKPMASSPAERLPTAAPASAALPPVGAAVEDSDGWAALTSPAPTAVLPAAVKEAYSEAGTPMLERQTAVSLSTTPPSTLPVTPIGQPLDFSPHHEPMPLGQTSGERVAVPQPRSEKAAPIPLAGQAQPPAAPTTPSMPSASWPTSAGQTPLVVSAPILASALPHTPPTPQPVVPQRPPAPMRVEQGVEMGEKRPFSPPNPTPNHAQATNQAVNFAPLPLPPVPPPQPPKPFTWPTLPQPNSPTNLGQAQRHNAGRRQRLNQEQRGR